MLKTISEIALKRCIKNRLTTKTFCTTTTERLESFRTAESNPQNHTRNNLSQFYKLPENDKNHLFSYGGIPKSYQLQAKTFNETCIMIREPALDIINCLKSIDYAKPPVRFVLYGKNGCGKSLTLSHVLHFAYKDGFLLVHVPWAANWMRRCKESSNSDTKEGFIDTNIDAAAWLVQFKTQNSHLLNQPEYKTSVDYVWSKRETTNKGSTWLELIEHGINRIKYASECVVALSNEIKKLADSGGCKTLVAIDGYNAFFHPTTRIFTEKKEMVHPHKVTVTEAFLNLTKFDWKNSAIVVVVDELATGFEEEHQTPFPRYLLGKDGFEHLDPFVPIPVSNYSQKEFLSCMNYFRERKWVKSFPGQDEELSFLSGSNPFKLMNICAPL